MRVAETPLPREISKQHLMGDETVVFMPAVNEKTGRLHGPRPPALAQCQLDLMRGAGRNLSDGAGKAGLDGAVHMTAEDTLDLGCF